MNGKEMRNDPPLHHKIRGAWAKIRRVMDTDKHPRNVLLLFVRSKDGGVNMDEKGQNGETVLIGTVEHLDVERIISMHEKLARK